MSGEERASEGTESESTETISSGQLSSPAASARTSGAVPRSKRESAERDAPSAESDRRAAESFIAGEPLDATAARELEKRLARHGEQDLAVKMRQRRIEADVKLATQILGSSEHAELREMFELAKRLKQYKELGHARRLLMLACERVTRKDYPDIYTKIFQQAALCTYKDPDLPREWKLDRAEEILGKTEDVSETRDPGTLGIAGAIFKRKWDLDGKRQNLERALFCYLKGYAQGASDTAQADILAYLEDHPGARMDATRDQGYTGINAAFILDVLAAREEREAEDVGLTAASAAKRRRQARLIREEIARSVPALLEDPDNGWLKEEWWYYATVGEAFFGLGRFTEALEWLVKKPQEAGLRVARGLNSAAGMQVPEWEYESTARQLAQLARLQCQFTRAKDGQRSEIAEAEFANTEAARTLREFLGGEAKAVLSAFRGRFGLALSGGGFRASLFHIGVLARLAEIDALRHVEVLSCVSGGSIVGAYYYLEVRKLLQTKTDAEIDSKDYVEIVQRMQEHFLDGVQRNIRTRVLAEISTNLKMIFSAGYSRTVRVGELYERELYAKIGDREDGTSPVSGPKWLPDIAARVLGFRREKRLLKDLCVFPKLGNDAAGNPQYAKDFKPRRDNWRRNNKVPSLVLNACSLNTGHNWQFTASYMGEPPLPIQVEIDCNYRLRRFYYKDAPRKSAPITLGHAVAASACVPGLFEPIVLDELYADGDPRRISVRLVDGGVCDNQGVASLLEQDCSVVLVSDGSGQMDAQDVPSKGTLGVPLRANSIFQARLREAQYGDIASRRRAGLLRGFMFVHLKQELAAQALAWRDCPPDQKHSDMYDWKFDVRGASSGMTSYGVSRETEAKLAGVRTDLDSFSEAEAYALMASGYRMAANQFRGRNPSIAGFPDPAYGNWKFREIEPAMAGGDNNARLDKLLDVASNTGFKIWKLLLPLIIVKWVLAAAAAAGVVWLFVRRWNEPLVPEAVRGWLTAELTFQSVAQWFFSLVVVAGVAFGVNALVGKARGQALLRAIRWRDTLKDIAIGVVMSLAGWVIARVHLHLFDCLYLRYGKIKHFSR